jgi:sarcosine/dimethylglycine N-methyltransferase
MQKSDETARGEQERHADNGTGAPENARVEQQLGIISGAHTQKNGSRAAHQLRETAAKCFRLGKLMIVQSDREFLLQLGSELERRATQVEQTEATSEVQSSPCASKATCNPLQRNAVTDVFDGVRDHYRATGLTERVKTALAAFGPEEQRLAPQQLASLDQFHTRGLAATAELAKLVGINADMSVLDVGSGVGGPARFLAATYGCRVTGVDLSEPFVDAARYLTERTGQSGQVSFETASALELPFDEGTFDVVLLQHVAMNIADKARLYREIRRVLKSGGRFATFDVVLNGGAPHYPLPWARTPATSFLLTAAATRDAIERAGFRTLAWQDDSEAANAWFAQLRSSGPPPSPNLGVVIGPDFAQFAANLGRSLMEGRLGILTAVFEAASTNT